VKIELKIDGSFLYPLNEKEKGKLKTLSKNAIYIAELNDKPKRTDKQNRALHLYFGWVADELNNAGLCRRLKTEKLGELEISWTKESVKDSFWKPIQEALLGNKNTSELTTKEFGEVYEHVNLYLTNKGISVPFPKETDEN
jgi:hypothetical protein